MASDSAPADGTDAGFTLEKKLTLWNGCGIIIGNIIGSGIFISPKGVLASCGSLGMSLLFWLLCGIYSTVGALCYAELGTTILTSGGDYIYIFEAFGPFPAFLQMWITILVLRPAAQAIIALSFAQYLVQPFFMEEGCPPPPESSLRLLAAVCILLICFVNCWSVRAATLINDLFAVFKLLTLALIIVTGFVYIIFKGQTQNFDEPFANTITNPIDLSIGFYMGMFAYGGWNYLNFVTEEIQNPTRNLPLAIIISMPIVSFVYILTNVAYFTALSPEELLGSEAVGVSFALKFLGPVAPVIPIFVAMSTFSGCNGSIFTAARLSFVGARKAHLPYFLAMINVELMTPITSVLLTSILSLSYLAVTDIGQLLTYFSFVLYLTIDICIVGMIVMRFTRRDLERPLKLPLPVPIGFCIICSFVIILSVIKAPVITGIGCLMISTGVPVYVIFVMLRDKLTFLDVVVRESTVFLQQLTNSCVESTTLEETGLESKDKPVAAPLSVQETKT